MIREINSMFRTRKGKLAINFVLMLVLGIMLITLLVTIGQQWLSQLGDEFINIVQ
jgi:hypothetical protein